MNQFKTFTGGVLDTNCFFYGAPAGGILFDAPQGADAAFAEESIGMLFLTHGHFDHVADASRYAKINFLRLMRIEMEKLQKPIGHFGKNVSPNPPRRWR